MSSKIKKGYLLVIMFLLKSLEPRWESVIQLKKWHILVFSSGSIWYSKVYVHVIELMIY